MKQALALLAVAQAADILTTWYSIAHGGREANPVTIAAVAFGGWLVFGFVKLGTVPVVAGLAYLAPTPRAQAFTVAAIRFVATMILGVAAGNVLVAL